jgi:hypothetical protein
VLSLAVDEPQGRKLASEPDDAATFVRQPKRQSAMISLRASAVLAKAGIIVLRVPLRLSAVRARYHKASALSF